MSVTTRVPAPARITRKDIDGITDVRGRTIEFIASQEIVDRDGDVIEVRGIDTRDFMRNPVLLADHDRTCVLGKVVKLWKDRLPDGWALLGKAEIVPEGTSRRADEAYREITFGARAGISIGFLPTQREPSPTGTVFKAVSLLEISSVALPSCPRALITAKTATWRRKEEPMYLDVQDDVDADAVTDAVCATLARALIPTLVRVFDGVELETDEARARRLATERTAARFRWMNERLASDLRYKAHEQRALNARRAPGPRIVPYGGWY